MLSFKRSPDELDLPGDLPATTEDVLALQRARKASKTDPDSYWKFLEALADAPAEILREKKVLSGTLFPCEAGNPSYNESRLLSSQ